MNHDDYRRRNAAALARTAKIANAKNPTRDPRRKWGTLCAKPARQLTLDGWLARSGQDQEQDGTNGGTLREPSVPTD